MNRGFDRSVGRLDLGAGVLVKDLSKGIVPLLGALCSVGRLRARKSRRRSCRTFRFPKLPWNPLSSTRESSIVLSHLGPPTDSFRDSNLAAAIPCDRVGFDGGSDSLGNPVGTREPLRWDSKPTLEGKRAVSSAVERLVYTELVGGSIPSLPTTFITERAESGVYGSTPKFGEGCVVS